MVSIKKLCRTGSTAGVGTVVRGILLLFSVTGFGVSCATYVSDATYDGTYSTYEAKVVANPSEDAILGMWHRTAVDLDTNTYWDILFKSGGAGHSYYYNDDLLPRGNGEIIKPLTWNYLGNGVWSVKGFEGMTRVEVRLADGVLLVKGTSLWGPIRQVYRKMEL